MGEVRDCDPMGIWFEGITPAKARDWISRILAGNGPKTMSGAIKVIDPEGKYPRARVVRMLEYLCIRFQPPRNIKLYDNDEQEYTILRSKKIVSQTPGTVYSWFCEECAERAKRLEEVRAMVADGVPPAGILRRCREEWELPGSFCMKARDFCCPPSSEVINR